MTNIFCAGLACVFQVKVGTSDGKREMKNVNIFHSGILTNDPELIVVGNQVILTWLAATKVPFLTIVVSVSLSCC